MCINWANEAVAGAFHNAVFKGDEAEFEREGVRAPVRSPFYASR